MAESTSEQQWGKQSVVLSGGGADGAYEVGVLKALLAGKSSGTQYVPLDPDIFCGTSIGSFNASFLVSKWRQHGRAAISDLENVWLDALAEKPQGGGNGAYRFRANPLDYLDPRYYLPNPIRPLIQLAGDTFDLSWEGLQRSVHLLRSNEPLPERVLTFVNLSSFVIREPLERTVKETIDFDEIRYSPKKLIIAATNWEIGRVEYFVNKDMTGTLGPLAILASSAIPGFFPATPVGAIPYVDGGVLMNTPVEPAIDEGANTVHVIYMDPDVKNMPMADIENTLQTFYRLQLITWAKTVNQDIDGEGLINDMARLLEAVDPASRDIIESRLQETNPKSKIARRLTRDPVYRSVTIHRYHPREDLGGVLGFLNLNRDRIKNLMEEGFIDAMDHDCVESKCVLANKPETLNTGG
jgi:predicted acylesterase/phospholipase RssA